MLVMPISLRRNPNFSPTRDAILASQKWWDRGKRLSLVRYWARNSCSVEEAMAMMVDVVGFVTCAVSLRHERTRRSMCWWFADIFPRTERERDVSYFGRVTLFGELRYTWVFETTPFFNIKKWIFFFVIQFLFLNIVDQVPPECASACTGKFFQTANVREREALIYRLDYPGNLKDRYRREGCSNRDSICAFYYCRYSSFTLCLEFQQ